MLHVGPMTDVKDKVDIVYRTLEVDEAYFGVGGSRRGYLLGFFSLLCFHFSAF